MAKKAAKKKTANKRAAPKKAAGSKKKTAAKKKTAKKSTTKKSASKKAAPKKKAAQPEKATQKARTASKPKNTNTLSYTQTEFVENVKSFCGMEKRTEAKEICDDIAAFVKDSLKRGYKLPFLGLGKLYVRQTKARMGRNPATGETIRISAKKRVRFTPAKALKETVL